MSAPGAREQPPRPRGTGRSGAPLASGTPGAGPDTPPTGPADSPQAPDAALAVLIERIGAMLVSHEPGWRLPRMSELARRHHVGTSEVRAAIDHLIARQLIRRSPDGQLYRASPAEYLISVDGLAGLSATVDPMGRNLTCLSYGTTTQAATDSAANALRVVPGESLGVLRLAWAVDGIPAAISTTYLARHLAQPQALASWLAATAGRGELPLTTATGSLLPPEPDSRQPCHPRAVNIRMDLPPVSVARRLRLRPGQHALLVTVLASEDSGEGPATLTATVLRADMFSISLATAAAGPGNGRLDGEWSPVATDYRI